MKVGAWIMTVREERVRFSCEVQWEDRVRPPATIWFAWPAGMAEALSVDASVALLAAFPLAMSTGERRLQLEGAVSGRLADGVRTAMGLIATRHAALAPVHLDVMERESIPASTADARRAMLCLSGGVDALAALHANLQTMPPEHPARYRRALYVFGLNSYDFANDQPVAERLAAFNAHAARLAALCQRESLELVRVATNLRSLYPSFEAWGAVVHHSPLAAIGHAMRPRIHSMAISSDGLGISTDVVQLPAIIPLLGSHDLDVHAVQQMTLRMNKVRHLARWPDGLAVLRVCLWLTLPENGALNCGRCEKCVRTKLALLAVDEAALGLVSFSDDSMSPALMDSLDISTLMVRAYYHDLRQPLVEAGRADLAMAIDRGLVRNAGSPPPTGWRARWQRWRA